MRITLIAVSVALLLGAPIARGQDVDDVKRLKKEVELLERELKVARSERDTFKKENEGLKAKVTELEKGAAAKTDMLVAGSVWVGRRTANDIIKQEWQLKVTERKGEAFKGEIQITRAEGTFDTYKVEGAAPTKGDGVVSFQSAKTGFFQQSFSGKLNGGEMALTFSGKGGDGGPVRGSATLKPKH